MKLPGIEGAIISPNKLLDYLLSRVHPLGMAKARFFESHGFSRREHRLLSNALIAHARLNDVTKTEESRFGMKYVIEGELRCPDGRLPTVCAVWFISVGETSPRLVTAYPTLGDR